MKFLFKIHITLSDTDIKHEIYFPNEITSSKCLLSMSDLMKLQQPNQMHH